MNPLLIGVLIVLLVSVFHGYQKGFIKILVSLISFVLTIWLVMVVTPYISTYLVEQTGLYNVVKDRVTESFAEDNSRYDNTISENQTRTINSYEVPSAMKTTLITHNTQPTYTKLAVSAFEDYISSYLARLIINVAAFVCTFVMITIFLRMTFFSLELIARIPIIKGFNKFLGLFAGLMEGILAIWIFFLLITMFSGSSWGRQVYPLIEESYLLSSLYNNNILLILISTLL